MNTYNVIHKTGAMNSLNIVLTILLTFFLFTANANAATPWTTLLGTVDDDYGDDIVIDTAGNSYVTGYTEGNLEGASQGGVDMFVAKFDPSGNELWRRQEGTIEFDRSRRIALDGAGNVYVTGYTRGSLMGTNLDGFFDYFIIKYDTNGNRLWGNQYGGLMGQYGGGIDVAPNGDIYVCGEQYQFIPNAAITYYAFITKFDSNGNELWSDNFGAPTVGFNQAREYCTGVKVGDDGFIYMTGGAGDCLTGSCVGGGDIFFAKYTSGGNRLWLRETGTGLWDRPGKIAVDAAGNSYTSGWTVAGGLDFGDMLTVKVNTNGARQWEVRESSTTLDEGRGVAVDSNGIVYVVGTIGSGFPITMVTYDSNGNRLSLDNTPAGGGGFATAIAVDSAGTNYYIAGYTNNDLFGENNNGGQDAFVTHNTLAAVADPGPVPDPVLVTVPDVEGLAEDNAVADIEALGLVASVSYANSDTVTAGDVISQTPSGGTDVAEGSTVNLVVSDGPVPGPEPDLVEVPDVVGDRLSTAIATIEDAGLTVGNITTVRTRRSCGIVRSQFPAGGTDVAPGTAIDLVVTRTRRCNPL